MRAAIAHIFYSSCGGGEKVHYGMAGFLLESGYDVEVYTPWPPNLDVIKALDPKCYEVAKQVKYVQVKESTLARTLRAVGRAARAALSLEEKGLFESVLNSGADLIVDTFSNLNILPVVYFHQPNPVNRPSEGKWSVYELVVRWAFRNLESVKSRTRVAMANSTWTADGVRKTYGLDPSVVNPPVDVEEFMEAAKGPHNENLVITVSRIGPGKHPEKLVDVAAKMRDFEFYWIGETMNRTRRALKIVKARVEELNVTNFHIVPNLPKDKVIELMSRAKAYLHPPFPEHFGIAVAEAMAAGLPPVVFRDGGAWTDMASRVDPALGYETVEEAVKALRYAIENRERLAPAAIRLTMNFTYGNFKAGVARALKETFDSSRT